MFREWLKENKVRDFDYSGVVFEKASNREFWESKFKKKYVENAEQYLGFEWPIIRATDYIAFRNEGNRVKQEKPHFKKRKALIALLVGELMEYKGRFIPDIVDGIYNICEESFWGLSAHHRHGVHVVLPCGEHYIDLNAAETGALLSIVLYLLRDELYNFWPEIVERIEYNLTERIVKPYIKYKNFYFMFYNGRANNWNPWVLSNILTVFLLSFRNNDVFYAGIEKMIYELGAIYIACSDDGGCDEGINYWGVSGGAIYEFCEQLYLATNGKINFFNDDKIVNIGDYPYKAYIGNNYYVNFADGNSNANPVYKSILYGYGKRTGNENLCGLSQEDFGASKDSLAIMRTTYTKRVLNNIICADSENYKSGFKLCENALLPDIQNAFAREGKWYYAAKGGHNSERHNHNDVGSFLAYYDCSPVLVDPGRGVYTKQTFSAQRYEIWTMRSEWHNLPVINGKQQLAGKEYCADDFSFEDKNCKISFFKAYEDGTNLNKLIREISVSDSGIEVNDEFNFDSKSNDISEHFVTPLNVEIKKNAVVIGGKYLLSCDCDTEISVDKQDFFGDETLVSSWNVDAMNRIIFKVSADEKTNIKFNLRNLQ